MRRLVAVGAFLEIALLIVGLTWIGKTGTGGESPTTAAATEQSGFRIEGDGTGTVVDVNLVAEETTQTIADGIDYHVWTFNGTAPAPVIRVKLGDTIHFTLTNNSSIGMAHSIDFHAAQTPWDRDYQPVGPGQSASFDWVARFPGVFMYHCGVPPVLMHIANGMYGAIIVEPRDLPPAREYVLVNSEFYPGAKPVKGVYEGDLDRMLTGNPAYVVWNGVFNQYQTAPLEAKPNELIRLWVMNAGPTLTSAFHVIGALFDHVYADGNPTSPMNGIQTWNVPPGGGAMFEMRIPDAGLYPFVTHAFAYAGLGAVGVIKIDPNAAAAPTSYPLMGDPFSAGVTEASPVAAGGGTSSGGGTSTDGSSTGGSSGGTDHGTSTASIDMAISGFVPKELDVDEGKITLTLNNLDAFPHDLTIDALGVKISLEADQTVTESFDAKPGVYEFYCSIPGHKEAGMVGSLTVLPTMAH